MASQLTPLSQPKRWLSRDSFDTWVREHYEPWLLDRTEIIAVTRNAAQRTRRHPMEGPIASAIVGFVALDTNANIAGIEFPHEVEASDDYPEIVESIEGPLSKLNEVGFDAFGTCAKVQGPTELSIWLSYCRKRAGSANIAPQKNPTHQTRELSAEPAGLGKDDAPETEPDENSTTNN